MRRHSYLYFAIPSLAVLSVVLFYPLGYAFYLSFFNYRLGSLPRFMGLGNYIRVFLQADFLHSVGVSSVFTGGVLGVQLLLGLSIGLMLAKIGRGRRVFPVIIFLPVMMTPAVAALILRWMFIPRWGIVNYLLEVLYVRSPNWFDDPLYALILVMLADIWQFTPFVAIIIFAGLQSLPQECVEAAVIDGASRLQMLRYIILPLLKPLILFILVIRTMDAWRMFDKIYVLTGGGPGTATETLTLYNYRVMFRLLRVGEGATIGVWTLFFLLGVIGIYLYLLYERESYA